MVVSVVANPFFRKTDKADDFDTPNSVNDSDMPRITVLVLANNNAQALDANLSIILTQDYAPGYEVIVGRRAICQQKRLSNSMHIVAICMLRTFLTARSL